MAVVINQTLLTFGLFIGAVLGIGAMWWTFEGMQLQQRGGPQVCQNCRDMENVLSSGFCEPCHLVIYGRLPLEPTEGTEQQI